MKGPGVFDPPTNKTADASSKAPRQRSGELKPLCSFLHLWHWYWMMHQNWERCSFIHMGLWIYYMQLSNWPDPCYLFTCNMYAKILLKNDAFFISPYPMSQVKTYYKPILFFSYPCSHTFCQQTVLHQQVVNSIPAIEESMEQIRELQNMLTDCKTCWPDKRPLSQQLNLSSTSNGIFLLLLSSIPHLIKRCWPMTLTKV